MSWPLNFRLTDSEVQVRVGRWVVRRVALSDIREASVATGLRVPLWNEHWCNFWPSRYVVLRRRSGWIATFIINPPEPEEFLAELLRHTALPPGGCFPGGGMPVRLGNILRDATIGPPVTI